jgi:hypothetical protein
MFHTRIVTSPGYARGLTDLLERSLRRSPVHGGPSPAVMPVATGEPPAASRPRALVLRRAQVEAPAAEEVGHQMLTDAVQKLLTKLREYLPPPGAQLPTPSVSLVRLQEKQLGLGQYRALEAREHFPLATKGLRLATTARFQLWAATSDAVEALVRGLIDAVLADRDGLVSEGFLELSLRDVTVSEVIQAGQPWRQIADFDLLYEFHSESTDDAGGLIARIPAELRPGLGSLVITGDVVVWDETGAATLALHGGGGAISGLSALVFAPGTLPTDAVTLLRTFEQAGGAPTTFATLDSFLAAVSGTNPASTHASFSAALPDFLNALGPAGAPVPFVDEDGNTRLFPTRFKAFPQPLVLPSRDDRLDVTFAGAALQPNQLLYLRALRGQPHSA